MKRNATRIYRLAPTRTSYDAAWRLHLVRFAAHVEEPKGRNERGTALMILCSPLVSLLRVYHVAQGRTPSFGTPLAPTWSLPTYGLTAAMDA